ncbi:MAG: HAMP domain-containing protein, partial [Chloroflexi bacterium]|nr:HAMP domain-containing protein [Chloroflexota bacterium]
MGLRWLGILTSRLRNKIVLPYILLTLVLALVSTFLLTRLVIGPVQDRLSNFLQDAAREANDALIEKQRDQLASLRAMLHTEGVASSVAARAVPRLQALLLPIKLNDRLDAVEVIDGDGRELLGILHGPDAEALSDYQIRSGVDLFSWPLVARILASPSQAQNPRSLELIETERGYTLYSGAPLLLDGDLVGAILVGNYLPNVVEEIGLQSLAQITLYDPEGQFLASTLPEAAEEGSPFAQMRTDLRTQLAATSGALRADLSWQGRRYAVIYAPLYLEQEAAGYLSVALPIDFLAQSAAQSQAWLIILFSIASFAVLAIGYLLAERITAPLHQLMLASQQVARGDFSKRIEARSGDEIDTLATAFNTMTQNLQEYADQLHQRIGELSLLYEASTALGRSLNIDQVLEVALDVIYRTGQLNFALLLLRDRATGLYVYRGLRAPDLTLDHLLQKTVPPTQDPLREALQQPSPTVVAAPQAPQAAEALSLPPWYGALILIPLLSPE